MEALEQRIKDLAETEEFLTRQFNLLKQEKLLKERIHTLRAKTFELMTGRKPDEESFPPTSEGENPSYSYLDDTKYEYSTRLRQNKEFVEFLRREVLATLLGSKEDAMTIPERFIYFKVDFRENDSANLQISVRKNDVIKAISGFVHPKNGYIRFHTVQWYELGFQDEYNVLMLDGLKAYAVYKAIQEIRYQEV